MKYFLIKLSVFLSIPFCYLGINSAINYYFICTNQSIPIEGKRVLIAGGSGPQKSLNPKYFNDAQNISQPTEHYILTFWKLKRIFNTYNPDTLILGFGPYNIAEFNDFKFSANEWSGELFKRSYLIENFSEIDKKIPVDYSAFYKTIIKQVAFYPQKSHVKFIGEYSNDTSSDVSTWKAAIKRHYFSNEKKLGFSNVEINYLDSIKNLCNSKQIKLVLVGSPVHKNYLENIPKPIWDKYLELLESYKKKCLVIDKTSNIYPDSLFLDATHLNEFGATRFTNEVISEIRKARKRASDNFNACIDAIN